jgi:hypothetical protein
MVMDVAWTGGSAIGELGLEVGVMHFDVYHL